MSLIGERKDEVEALRRALDGGSWGRIGVAVIAEAFSDLKANCPVEPAHIARCLADPEYREASGHGGERRQCPTLLGFRQRLGEFRISYLSACRFFLMGPERSNFEVFSQAVPGKSSEYMREFACRLIWTNYRSNDCYAFSQPYVKRTWRIRALNGMLPEDAPKL